MVFNFVDKNNTGSTIKNNNTGTQTPQKLVIGTIYSCKKDAVPSTAATNHFYYVQEENKLFAGQGKDKPLIEISGGLGGANVDLSGYVTKGGLTSEINAVKALIPDITEYMKTADITSALAGKADQGTTYTKQEVDNLVAGIQAGTVDLSLYLTKADAANTYALKAHTHDMSNYATKSDVSGFVDENTVDSKISAAVADLGDGDLKKADADTYYAPVNHTHDDMYTKTQTDSQISAAIAQAKLNGSGSSVDLSGFLKTTDAETTYLKKADAVTSSDVQSLIDNSGHLTSKDIANLLDKNTADSTYQPIGNYVDQATVKTMIDGAGHLTNADIANLLDKATADGYYQPKGNYADTATVQSMIDNAGHLTSADIAGFISKTTADGLYQAKGDYVDKSTVQGMIDGAGHLTAADISGLQNDINDAKADAAAAKTSASEIAKDVEKLKTDVSDAKTAASNAKTAADNAKSAADAAQATADTAKATADDAKAKAESNATDIAAIKSTVSDVKATADAAKAQADANKTDIEGCVKKDELKSLVEQYVKEMMSSSGDSGDSGNSGSGSTTTPSTGGETKTMKIEAGKGATICLSSIGVEFTEEQVTSGKVHFLIMPGDKGAVEVYVRDNYPGGMEIPICYESMSGNDETKAYDKIWHDLSYENPGWINGFASSTDSEDTYDTLEMMSHTVASSWTIGVRIDD